MNHLQYPVRCGFYEDDPEYVRYHDEEWGTPVHDETDHFMYLLMESMSCGLSWKMVLDRREVFRKCFAGFDAAKVAQFNDADVERIMATEGMIRSPRKIRAMINNAQAFMRIEHEFGSFDSYIWGFTWRPFACLSVSPGLVDGTQQSLRQDFQRPQAPRL